MKLKDIYRNFVDEGIKYDPRGKDGVEKYLVRVKKQYDSLSPAQKKYFDKEKLSNPFSDTRILYGGPDTEVKNIMVGIDVDTSEMLLADALKKRGKKIDLVLGHHPGGMALPLLHEVMNVQWDMLESLGVRSKKAKDMLDERMEEVMRGVHSSNSMRPVDTARALGIPYMCAHTVADNCVSEYLNERIDKKKPKTVGDIVDMLMDEPEYQYAASVNIGPKLYLGSMSNKCGKILLEMTGGTSGPKKIYAELAKAGVKTIVGMHMKEDHIKFAKKQGINVLIAGHMPSDSLGLNILLDAVSKKGGLTIIPSSGFIRVKRS